jgi:predicted RNase H-like nuclease (RuvC/YqgF family)
MIAAETPAVNDGEKADQSQKVRSQNIDIEKLRQQIAEQQKQIEAMQKTLADQQRMLDAASTATPTLRWAKWRAQRP